MKTRNWGGEVGGVRSTTSFSLRTRKGGEGRYERWRLRVVPVVKSRDESTLEVSHEGDRWFALYFYGGPGPVTV